MIAHIERSLLGPYILYIYLLFIENIKYLNKNILEIINNYLLNWRHSKI